MTTMHKAVQHEKAKKKHVKKGVDVPIKLYRHRLCTCRQNDYRRWFHVPNGDILQMCIILPAKLPLDGRKNSENSCQFFFHKES